MRFLKIVFVGLIFQNLLFSLELKKVEKITKTLFVLSFTTSILFDYLAEEKYQEYLNTKVPSDAEKLRKEVIRYDRLKTVSITLCISSGTISLLIDLFKNEKNK